MTLIELKKVLIEKMKTKYPESTYRYYGIQVVEGYQKPSFFTQLKPVTLDFSNRNSTENVLTFYITYFQKCLVYSEKILKYLTTVSQRQIYCNFTKMCYNEI